ncbi:MAG: C40 family peptidase [Psychroflexus sp.]|jgi:hypothetical protein|nr:C40 family peptidase [Psychroflexus sp.]MDR9448766.1 C40 family peptidase [Psychroflexus sp.]
MKYGLCHLSAVPLRSNASEKADLVSQLIYGDHFEILDYQKNWSFIRLNYDGYEGWVDNKQFVEISSAKAQELNQHHYWCSADLIEFVTTENHQLIPIHIGSSLAACKLLNHEFDGKSNDQMKSYHHIVDIAVLYLNAPYVWGGKSPFGIDCSGFIQVVYKICGIKIARDSKDQAKQGRSLSFIEECKPGDLAFFDNEEGDIVHVGIMMGENKIIHAHGQVRIDLIDHQGIFNASTREYSHKLRLLKTYND